MTTRDDILRACALVEKHRQPIGRFPVTVEEDAHGVVWVKNEHGGVVMFMHRREWDTLRAELGLPPLTPIPFAQTPYSVLDLEPRG